MPGQCPQPRNRPAPLSPRVSVQDLGWGWRAFSAKTQVANLSGSEGVWFSGRDLGRGLGRTCSAPRWEPGTARRPSGACGHWTTPMDSEFHPSSTCHELLPFHSLPPPSSSPVSAAGRDRTRRRVGRVCRGAAVGHQSRNVPPQRAWGQRGARTVLATCLEEVCASAFPGPRAPERTG